MFTEPLKHSAVSYTLIEVKNNFPLKHSNDYLFNDCFYIYE